VEDRYPVTQPRVSSEVFTQHKNYHILCRGNDCPLSDTEDVTSIYANALSQSLEPHCKLLTLFNQSLDSTSNLVIKSRLRWFEVHVKGILRPFRRKSRLYVRFILLIANKLTIDLYQQIFLCCRYIRRIAVLTMYIGTDLIVMRCDIALQRGSSFRD